VATFAIRLPGGVPGTARIAKMAELTEVVIAQASDDPNPSLKKLAKACLISPSYGEVVRPKPMLGPRLGRLIAEASGLSARVTALEEEDIPAELADVMVKMEAKGVRPEAMLPVLVSHGGTDRYFLLTMPPERVCDAFTSARTVEAAKKIVEAQAAYPAADAVAALEHEAPGIYMMLALELMRFAGNDDDLTLGEA
jgi:hypothetical protein